MLRKNSFCAAIVIGFVLLIATGCSRGELYHHYRHISLAKWDADSVLVFAIDSVQGNRQRPVQLVLMLTVNQTYSYQDLNLNVSDNLSGGDFVAKQLSIPVFDKHGVPQGDGVSSLKQLVYPIRIVQLSLDSTHHNEVRVRHAMTDNPLRGIEKVGICLLPKDANPSESSFFRLFQR